MNSKKQNKKQQNEKPNWQPISMISMIASIIDGEVQNFEDLYKKDFEDINVKYHISFEKLIRMYKNVLANGFTSYAEA